MASHYLKYENQLYAIEGDEVAIGRSSESDIKIINNRSVSRYHAKLIKEKQGYVIVDLKSSHGTFVNDDRVERKSLQVGDQIRFGQAEVVFTQQADTDFPTVSSTSENLQKSLAHLSSVFASSEYEEYSDLKKINCILEVQTQWGQGLSPDDAFGHILKAVLDISGAERGCIFVNGDPDFKYVSGMNAKG